MFEFVPHLPAVIRRSRCAVAIVLPMMVLLVPDVMAQAPATVMVIAQRPIDLDGFKETKDRIRLWLATQPKLTSEYLGSCMEHQFDLENNAVQGGSLPLLGYSTIDAPFGHGGTRTSTALDIRIACGRNHIEARDLTMREGLDAFDKRDYAAALGLFRQAYEKMGLHDAAVMLARMHLDGIGTAKDTAAGIKWLEEVAGGGFDPKRELLHFNPKHPQAMNARVEAAMMLGRIYEFGAGAPADARQANRWYTKAAEFGFVPALDSLGQAYLSGPAGVKDPARAAGYFKQAVEAGYVRAAYHLGKLYHDGADSMAPDLLQAGAYFEFAARAGDADALLAAGQMYEKGETVASNPVRATAYYTEAAAKGNADAQLALDSLSGQQQASLVPDAAPLQPAMADGAEDAQQGNLGTIAHAQAPTQHSAPEAQPNAQQTSSDGAGFVVRVSGLRAVSWKSYRALHAATAAFKKNHALAPDAALAFGVLPPPGKKLPPGFQLRVRTRDGRELPVALENGELFQLPILPDPDVEADLVSNFKEGPLRIGLLVHSPSVPPEKERLGDVRLMNIISQVIAEVDHGDYDPRCWRKRRGNDCPQSRATVWYKPRAPAGRAWVIDGKLRAQLKSNGNANYPAFNMPVYNEDLGNDAIIEFEFTRPLGPVTLSTTAIYEAKNE